MANTIKVKRSSTQGAQPTTNQLDLGEIAINTYDGKVFIKKDNGTASIVEIGAAGSGITSLNGLTGGTQTFAVGSSGSDFAITSSGTTHTFGMPDASTTARGLVTTGTQSFTGEKTFVASGAAVKPFVAKGAASQTANLLEAQNSSGTAQFSVGSAGAGYFLGSVGIGKSPTAIKLEIDAGSGAAFKTNTTGAEAATFYTTNTFQALRMETNQASCLHIFNFQYSGVAKGYVGHAGSTNRTFLGNDTILLNLFESGTYSGRAGLNTLTPGGKLQIDIGTASLKGLIVKGAASQTGNLFELQNSSATALVTVTAGGLMGVGATSPTSSLQVAGAVDTTPDAAGVHVGTDSSNSVIELANSTGSYIDFTAAGTDYKGRIKYTNATDQLDIISQSKINFYIGATDGGGMDANRYWYLKGSKDRTTALAANAHMDSTDGGIYRSTSSIKYKTDVQDYDKGLAEAQALRPVYYKSLTNGDLQFAGLIAEEVDAAGFSEFVMYAEDGSPDALAYQNMVALLLNCTKELNQKVQALEQAVAALSAN